MKRNHFLTLAAAVALLTACTNDDFTPLVDEMTDTPVTVSGAGVATETDTRADAGSTTPLTDGSLGLYFSTTGTTDAKYTAQNREVSYNASSAWTIQGSNLLWLNAETQVHFAAYHPYKNSATETGLTVAVPTDQSSAELMATADFLAGVDEDGTKGSDCPNGLDILLNHQMSKLVVQLTIGDELEGHVVFKELTVSNVTAERAFNITASAISWGDAASGTAAVKMYKSNDCVFQGILLPQASANYTITIELSVGDATKYYTYTPAAGQTFEAGYEYTLNLQVGKTKAEMGKVSVAAWKTQTLTDGEAEELNLGYTVSTDQEGIKTYTVYADQGLVNVNKIMTQFDESLSDDEKKRILASNITLTTDITLPPAAATKTTGDDSPASNWTPIGTSQLSYTGTFSGTKADGSNHTITGLTIIYTDSSAGGGQGLIGFAKGATIQGVTLIGCTIMGVSSVGGIMGGCWNADVWGDTSGCTVDNCIVKATQGHPVYISAPLDNVGGIVGWNVLGNKITNCHVLAESGASVTITGPDMVGGIVGMNGSEISGCTAQNNGGTFRVTAPGVSEGKSYGKAGGIVGFNGNLENKAIVSACLAQNVYVHGTAFSGGIAGQNGMEPSGGGFPGGGPGMGGSGIVLVGCYAYQCTTEATADESEPAAAADESAVALKDETNIVGLNYESGSVESCYFYAYGTDSDGSTEVTEVSATSTSGNPDDPDNPGEGSPDEDNPDEGSPDEGSGSTTPVSTATTGGTATWDEASSGAAASMNNAIDNEADNLSKVYHWGGAYNAPTLTDVTGSK